MRKLSLISLCAVLATAVAAAPVLASTAQADPAGEQRSFSLVNQERTSRGLHALSYSDDLARIARKHSFDMASRGELYHNDNLPNEVSGWRKLGENVGEGPSVEDIHQAFMDSSEHRANILGDYTRAGMGVVKDSDGSVWVTQVFELPAPAPRPAARSTVSIVRARSLVHFRTQSGAVEVIHAVPKPPAKVVVVDETADVTMSMLQRLTDDTVVPQSQPYERP